MMFLVFVAMAAAGLATLLNLVFATEIVAGATARPLALSASGPVDTVVVVPANDEAEIIGTQLSLLQQQLGEHQRILVVADNCTDDTAAIARASGAEVIVRDDRTRIGKGHALAAASAHLAQSPPAVVVVLDADCRTDRTSLTRLIDAAVGTGRPAQAMSLLSPSLDGPPLVQVSNFAFAVKNRLRNVGLFRITGRALLTGTGMAIPWALYSRSPLSSNSEVEDIELGLYFTRLGHPPLDVIDAVVWSAPSTVSGTRKQRTRWERGFLNVSVHQALPMLGRGLARFDGRLAWLGLNLLVPPLSLLAMVDALVGLIALAAALVAGSLLPLALVLGSTVVALLAVTFGWHRAGRPFLAARTALMIPVYIFWKLPVYLGIFNRKPRGWLRTGR